MDLIEISGFLIFLVPLLAFPVTLLIGKINRKTAGVIATTSIFISFLLAFYIFFNYHQAIRTTPYYVSYTWFYNFTFGIYIDSLSITMALMVSFVSFLIHLFAIGYMGKDPNRHVYFAETALFTSGMLGLVLASNMVQFFVFWELVGLCSYLLIGFWWYKPNAASAAKKAFIVTRIGDVLLLLGIAVLYYSMTPLNSNPLSIPIFLSNVNKISTGNLTLIGLLFLGGAIGKSAQFPLHVWIPDAMEGPATVSALIHAATMVTAGVYLIARVFPIYLGSTVAIDSVLFIGAFTAFLAGTMGLVVNDIKRVLAYSTISQIGYMTAALGIGGLIASSAVSVSLYQLVVHAFFKALLFLAAGAIMYSVLDTRDIRKLGGLWRKMPITISAMFIGALTLIGFPLTAGFFSKDEIITLSYYYFQHTGDVIPWLLLLIGALLTTLYTFRMFFLVALGKPNSYAAEHAKEPPKIMLVPIVVLAVMSLTFGYWQEPFYSYVSSAPAISENLLIEFAPSILMFIGLGLTYVFYGNRRYNPSAVTNSVKPLYKLVKAKYYLDYFYTYIIAENLIVFAAMVTAVFDRGVVDGTVNGIATVIKKSGALFRKIQTGTVQNYSAMLIIGIILLLLILKLMEVLP